MKLVSLDFETWYDRDYTLRKMPLWQYLRDPRFQVLGCAVQVAGQPAQYVQPDGLPELFRQLGTDVTAVAHNADFDAAVAWHAYGWAPARWFDTLKMARYAISQGHLAPDQRTSLAALAPLVGMEKGDTGEAVAAGGQVLTDYALTDLTIMNALLAKLYPLQSRMELALQDLHVRMAAYPALELDRDLLAELARGAEIPEHVAKACRSRDKFVALLEKRGVQVEYKTTDKGHQAPALAKTDTFMQRLQKHPDPTVRRLAEIRLQVASTIKQSRSQRFLDIGSPLPVPLLYYGAHTGRASGLDKMNMQNLPARGDAGRIRHALRAPAGYKLVICDSGQIEVRVIGWLAGCRAILDTARAFDAGTGADFYVTFASEVMYPRTPLAEVTPEQRKVAKPPVLACGFGQGWRGLIGYAEGMGVELTEQQAQRAVDGYRSRYPEVVRFWDQTKHEGRQQLPSGRCLMYPDLHMRGRDPMYYKHQIFSRQHTFRDQIKIWHGLLTENIVQAVARDVVMWQTLQLARLYRVVLSVHDEVVLMVPEDQAEQAARDAEYWFSQVPPWAEGLPVAGEAAVSDHYQKG